MKIALFSQVLANLPAQRVAALNRQFGIECVYVLVWPNYEPPAPPVPQQNRFEFADWGFEAGVPIWAWLNAQEDQAADATKIAELDQQLKPSGWLLDIEGKWVGGANLSVLCQAAVATGKPVRASLAGASSSHVNIDFRTLDKLGIEVDWQAYMDSGEGPHPADAVRELYQSSFVIPGWTYRHRLGKSYGWGKVTRVEAQAVASFDSFLRPSTNDATFAVSEREWGNTVVGRALVREGKDVGLLMGRAAYSRTRVTLDVTRSAQNRQPAEWVSIAASAKIPGSPKRGVSVYLAENTTDDVLAAIAAGAA